MYKYLFQSFLFILIFYFYKVFFTNNNLFTLFNYYNKYNYNTTNYYIPKYYEYDIRASRILLI